MYTCMVKLLGCVNTMSSIAVCKSLLMKKMSCVWKRKI